MGQREDWRAQLAMTSREVLFVFEYRDSVSPTNVPLHTRTHRERETGKVMEGGRGTHSAYWMTPLVPSSLGRGTSLRGLASAEAPAPCGVNELASRRELAVNAAAVRKGTREVAGLAAVRLSAFQEPGRREALQCPAAAAAADTGEGAGRVVFFTSQGH